jgi:HSP20 family protein
MKTLLRTNGKLFPVLPGLIEDFFNSDLNDSSVFNWKGFDATIPAVNIVENNDAYKIEVAAPGMKRENFKIEFENNILTIASHLENKVEESDDNKNFTRREFSYKSFQRTFSLPENKVEGEKIFAKYVDGILHITIPKREEAKVKPARQITVS